MVPEILSVVGNEKGLLTQIYNDLAKPGVSQVGAALGSVLGPEFKSEVRHSPI